MRHPKPWAVCCLIAGLLVAEATPLRIAQAVPGLAGYLIHPWLFAELLVPYALCAALWLPWRAIAAARTALVISGIMLVATVVVYAPMLLDPAAHGGDMIALAFVAITLSMTAGLLLVSAIAAARLMLRRRDVTAMIGE
jgi:hypothetical protein